MTCPLQKKYGDTICIDGKLWALTYSECAPPDQRACVGECPHCAKKKPTPTTCLKCQGWGKRGMDNCNVCGCTGSVFRVKGKTFPNTKEGYEAAKEELNK